MEKRIKSVQLSGKIQIPPSKSDGQRALLAAGLSEGRSIIYNLGQSADELAMIQNIQQFGAKVEIHDDKVIVDGSFLFPSIATFNCGESGLGLRLMTSICAVFEGEHRLIGEGTILNRFQDFFIDHFPEMGIEIQSNEGKLPIEIKGHLNSGKYVVDGSQSSQYISGLLMALPLLKGDSELMVDNLKSKPYVDMTIETLKAFGVQIQEIEDGYRIPGNQFYAGTEYTVESDWSSASCWLAAAAIGQKIEVSRLSISSRQADVVMLDALTAANCNVELLKDAIRVNGERRTAFTFDATDCPDLFPALVLLAVSCIGKSIIKGLHRLENKESNRGLVLQEEFQKLGVKIELQDDEMYIYGGTLLKSATVNSHNDHRIAMCLGIAGTLIEDGITIQNAASVKKSYPDFWEDLEHLSCD